MSGHPFDAAEHFRVEMARLCESLARLLRAQRERGRSTLGDAMQGLVVEDGEAEGLVLRLARAWAPRGATGTGVTPPRRGEEVRAQIAERARAAASQGSALPLVDAIAAFSMEPYEVDALLLAIAVELDAVAGRLVAYLNDHVQRTRPTLGLVAELTALENGRRADLAALLDRPIFRDGLLSLEGEGPAPALAVRVARDLVAHFSSGRARNPEPVTVTGPEAERLSRLVLPEPTRRIAQEWSAQLRSGKTPPMLVLAGPPGSGRAALARAIAGEAGRSLVTVPLPAEKPDAMLALGRREMRLLGHRAAMLVEVDGETLSSAAIRSIEAPLLVSAPAPIAAKLAGTLSPEPVVLPLGEPSTDERARIWKSLLGGNEIDDDGLSALAARFRYRPGAAAKIVRRASATVALAPEGARRVTLDVLEGVCRDHGATAMGPLAQRLPLPWKRADLVAPARVLGELELALAWIRHQRTVMDRWGFGRRIVHGRGLTALFSGPPGTGKTMGAQVLAREIGVDAWRVDLSRVMSKYIGETEKNLGALFDEAAASGAMLFFDEADAIFGKRSEVSDAHDRYANVEIGYLLQRMEEHDGITVLATNRQGDLDEAFTRRFHLIVDFPMPEESDRLRIWKGVLPPEVAVDAAELAAIARDYETSGGEIKNAALAAAFMAAAEGATITGAHLRRAVTREMIKSGKVVDGRG